MKIILVAAIGQQRQLGLNNELLWKLPGDLPRFKAMTMGSPIVMGRKTFDSIGKPLPGRTNIVISRNTALAIDGVTVVASVEAAVKAAKQEQAENIFVIGGGEIYTLFLPEADVLELTLVDDSPEADAFFPEYLTDIKTESLENSESAFLEVTRETNQSENLRYHYVRYERANRTENNSSSS